MAKKKTIKQKLAYWWNWSDVAYSIRCNGKSVFDIGKVIGIFLGVVIAFWVVITAFMTPYVLMERTKCNQYAPASQLEYTFDWWKGCLLKTSDGWIEYNSYMQSIEIRNK
jgi:hypothetical protein